MHSGLPWWNWVLQIICVVGSYAGAVLNARADIRGFYIWRVSNVGSLLIHAYSGLWIFCCLDVAYFWLNMTAPRNWARKSLSLQEVAHGG